MRVNPFLLKEPRETNNPFRDARFKKQERKRRKYTCKGHPLPSPPRPSALRYVEQFSPVVTYSSLVRRSIVIRL